MRGRRFVAVALVLTAALAGLTVARDRAATADRSDWLWFGGPGHQFRAAAGELGENFADDPTFHVPAIDWDRTSRRVLTQERVGGIALDEREALLDAGHDLGVVMRRAAARMSSLAFS